MAPTVDLDYTSFGKQYMESTTPYLYTWQSRWISSESLCVCIAFM